MLARNVIFNQLLESGDHGPINTWSRTAYLQNSSVAASATAAATAAAATATTIQEWNRIDNNFVMVGPKMGSLYGLVWKQTNTVAISKSCSRGNSPAGRTAVPPRCNPLLRFVFFG